MSTLGCKATVNALTHCSSKHILVDKFLVILNVYIKSDPTRSRSNTVPSLSPLPQPLRHPFDHPVIEMKAVPLKSQDGKFTSVYFKTKLHLHMGAERGEKVPHWLLCRPVRAEDRSCHHCQEPGGHRLRHRQEVHLKYFPKCKINSLMQALVSPSSGCLALRVLKKKNKY